MRKKYFIWIIILFLFLTASTGAVNAETPIKEILGNSPDASAYPGEDAVVMLDKGIQELTPEGKIRFHNQMRIKIFTREGKNDYGEIKIPFSSELEEVQINYARTITADGEIVKPDEEAVREITHPRARDAAMYSDIKLKVISMPALDKGSIIDYSYTISRKPMMQNQFFGQWYFKGSAPVINSEYRVVIPADRKLYWQSFRGEYRPTVKNEGTNKTYTWQEQDIDRIYNETGRPPNSVLSPRIIVSTLNDWQKLAGWYSGLLEDRLSPDEEIKEKVEELTRGINDEQEKIARIFDFVATKIRYVALEFGLGKVQPYNVKRVYRNRYGDCKDQASLLVSMLRAAGIDAYLTLIKGGMARKTYFDGPATLGGFNHAITAVKNSKTGDFLFLDPTCDICNWKYLPEQDRNKEVMVIYNDGGKVVKTPPLRAELSPVKTVVRGSLSEEGKLQVKSSMSPEGKWGYVYRSFFQQYKDDEKKQIFQQVLNQHISGASFTEFTHSKADNNLIPVKLTVNYNKESYGQKTAGMLMFKVPPTLRIPFIINYGQVISKPTAERRYPLVLSPTILSDSYKLEIPPEFEARLPEDKNAVNDYASYKSSYRKEGSRLLIERNFKIKKAIIEPGTEYKKVKQIIEIMLEDINSQLVLQ